MLWYQFSVKLLHVSPKKAMYEIEIAEIWLQIDIHPKEMYVRCRYISRAYGSHELKTDIQTEGKVTIDVHTVKDKNLFIGPHEFVVGYSKAPEQPQSSARPIHVILTLWRGWGANQPPCTLLHRSSPRYALRHGGRRWSGGHEFKSQSGQT